jgi:hypothetical protein
MAVDSFTSAYQEFTAAKDGALGGEPPVDEPAEEIEGLPPEDPGPALDLEAEEPEPEEPELTPEEAAEQERMGILQRNQELLRDQRVWESRNGRPVIPPEEIEKRVRREEAEASVRVDTPQVADAVENIVDQRLAREREILLNEVDQRAQEAAFEIHQQAIAAAHPDYFEVLAHPEALMEWIDSLPGWLSDKYKEAFDYGGTNEVIGMLNDWKDYPDPNDAAAAITAAFEQAQGGGAPEAEGPAEERSPAARPRARTDELEAARAVRGRGTTNPAAPTGAQAPDEFTSAYRFFNEAERNSSRRSG